MPDTKVIKLALIDDHKLFRKGLRGLIEILDTRYVFLFEADNGLEMQDKLDENNLPHIIIMDVNMPKMNGFDSVIWLNENHPEIRILVVSMIEKDETIVAMLKLGVKGYLCKDVEPNELKNAINAINDKNYYYTDFITGKLVHALRDENAEGNIRKKLNNRELEFLNLACSELTYVEIADKMFLSPKTIDGYRSSLFEKLNVKSRVGLAIFAIKNGWVEL